MATDVNMKSLSLDSRYTRMKIDPVLISLCALGVSIFTLAWRVYEWLDDKRGRITLEPCVVPKVPVTYGYYHGNLTMPIIVLITNKSKKPRYIKHPSVITDPQFDEIGLPGRVFNLGVYPLLLQPGEEHRFNVDIEELVLAKNKGAKKVMINVSDTHGKGYHSKWHTL